MIVSSRRFDEIVADAIDALPEAMLRMLDNIAVIVEDEATVEQLESAHSDSGRGGTDPRDLLGLYEGAGQATKGVLLPGYLPTPIGMPDRVILFRKALCAISTDDDDLFHNVYETLVHEFAHHFGIDDDRLDELGWA